MEYRGIDVSSFQESVFWNEVQIFGIQFAMIRATYGTSGIDKRFHNNIIGISQTNIAAGAYHYCYAMNTDEAVAEANHFLDIVSPYKFYYPLALDIEEVSISELGKEKVTDIILAFTNTLREKKYYPMVYLNLSWVRNFVDLERISDLDIWLADWSSDLSYSKNVTIWQHSQDGEISGITGGVDLNTSFEDYPEIIKRLGLNNTAGSSEPSPEPNPEPGPSPEPNPNPEPSDRPVFYTVKNGDSLWSIAQRFLGNGDRYREIMALNGLNDETIYPGQVLRIPQGASAGYVLYRVRSGDTLWEIAQRFLGNGSKYTEIMSLNGLTNDMVYAGQILRVPVDSENVTITYTVRPGDTLWGIAQRFLGDGSKYTEIMNLNELANDKIKVGQKLKIPS